VTCCWGESSKMRRWLLSAVRSPPTLQWVPPRPRPRHSAGRRRTRLRHLRGGKRPRRLLAGASVRPAGARRVGTRDAGRLAGEQPGRRLRRIPLEEAIRKLTSLPTGKPQDPRPRPPQGRLLRRPRRLRSRHHPGPLPTYEKPHQYSTGVRDVFVNGIQVWCAGRGGRDGRSRGPCDAGLGPCLIWPHIGTISL